VNLFSFDVLMTILVFFTLFLLVMMTFIKTGRLIHEECYFMSFNAVFSNVSQLCNVPQTHTHTHPKNKPSTFATPIKERSLSIEKLCCEPGYCLHTLALNISFQGRAVLSHSCWMPQSPSL